MVNYKKAEQALSELSTQKTRKFDQSVDFIVTFKDIDMKKTDQQVDFYVTLNYTTGKNVKICALVGPEMIDDAKPVFDRVIGQSEFDAIAKDKKQVKQLANEYDYFVAQANIMGQIAAAFGRVLGPRGKMPNPKAGCVVAPKAALQPLYDRLTKTVRIRSRDIPMIQLAIGKQSQDVTQVMDNIKQVYTALVSHLPQDVNNIRAAYVKLSMSTPIQVN